LLGRKLRAGVVTVAAPGGRPVEAVRRAIGHVIFLRYQGVADPAKPDQRCRAKAPAVLATFGEVV
jgi:hypothetical protein